MKVKEVILHCHKEKKKKGWNASLLSGKGVFTEPADARTYLISFCVTYKGKEGKLEKAMEENMKQSITPSHLSQAGQWSHTYTHTLF